MGTSNKRKRSKKKQNNKNVVIGGKKVQPHRAASHHYKRHPSAHHHNGQTHPVNLKRHLSKDTRIPVKQIKFQLQLPSINNVRSKEYRDMPWYRPPCNDKQPTTTTSSSSLDILQHVSSENLARLDQELLAFAEYVKLTPTECHAREYVIEQVTQACQSLFGRRKRHSEIYIQAFGSYATPNVCTFASDVDLAIWGVVPVATHVVFGEKDWHDEKAAPKDCIGDGKEDRIQKWKEALAELDAQEKSDEELLQKRESVADNAVAPASVAVPDTAEDTSEPTRTILENEGGVRDGETSAESNDVEANGTRRIALAANENSAHEPLEEQETGDFVFVIDRVGDTLNEEEMEVPFDTRERPDTFQDGRKEDTSAAAAAAAALDAATLDAPPAKQPSLQQEPLSKAPFAVNDADESAKVPLFVDHQSESEQEYASDSDADSADKLESYRENSRAIPLTNNTDSDSDVEDGPIVSLSDYENNDLEVSFVSHASKDEQAADSTPVGPTGETRRLVVGALKSLGKALWKNPIIHTIEVRRHARVPIIATGTHLGFEGDIALGGHNGTDTSQYAATQAERFESFAPVVLFLKVLLGQQALDKPFTGGLGSYKLYVLVAHHLEEHLALGGTDRPSEVLITFFYRFRKFRDKQHRYKNTTALETCLSQNKTIRCDGGSADLQAVFKLPHCCDLFTCSWQRLIGMLETENSTIVSFLSKLVHSRLLRAEREQNRRKASKLGRYSKLQQKLFAKENTNNPSSAGKKRSFSEENGIAGDANAGQLMAGYGVKRGPHGGLIPENRPDVEARSSLPEAIGRATKNRKNKKKQKRDEGLKAIALQEAKRSLKTRNNNRRGRAKKRRAP